MNCILCGEPLEVPSCTVVTQALKGDAHIGCALQEIPGYKEAHHGNEEAKAETGDVPLSGDPFSPP